MGTGIIFYSRSGHSKRLADRLAQKLGGEVLEILAPAYASPVIGYARAGFDSLRQHGSGHASTLPSLTRFDRVILCGPVWTSYPAVPLRDLMRADVDFPESVSLFLTSGMQSPTRKAFATGSADLGRPFAATASLPNAAENTDEEDRIIANFLTELQTTTRARTPN